MFSRTTSLVLVGVLAWAALAEAGQRSSRKWWMAEEIQQELGLTEAQASRLEAIFQESLPALRSTKKALDEREDALSKLLVAASLDERAIMAEIERIEDARSEMGKQRTLMLFRMYRVLSPEQRVQLRAFHERSSGEKDRDRRPDRRR